MQHDTCEGKKDSNQSRIVTMEGCEMPLFTQGGYIFRITQIDDDKAKLVGRPIQGLQGNAVLEILTQSIPRILW